MDEPADLCRALRELADEIRLDRQSREQMHGMVDQLERAVNRFVVCAERQLASSESSQRRAERVLNGMAPEEARAIREQVKAKLGGKR